MSSKVRIPQVYGPFPHPYYYVRLCCTLDIIVYCNYFFGAKSILTSLRHLGRKSLVRLPSEPVSLDHLFPWHEKKRGCEKHGTNILAAAQQMRWAPHGELIIRRAHPCLRTVRDILFTANAAAQCRKLLQMTLLANDQAVSPESSLPRLYQRANSNMQVFSYKVQGFGSQVYLYFQIKLKNFLLENVYVLPHC